MDDKPAIRQKAVKEGPAPQGMDIKAKLKKQAEAKPEAQDKPEPPKKKAKD